MQQNLARLAGEVAAALAVSDSAADAIAQAGGFDEAVFLEAAAAKILVQPMAPPGREVMLGINRDPTWGLLLMVGLGGVLVEALGDVALAPVPLDIVAAHALLDRLKGAQIFGPFRGLPPADTKALAELMVRLAQFAADHADDIDAIDLNPVIVHAQGVSVVDALILRRDNRRTDPGAAE